MPAELLDQVNEKDEIIGVMTRHDAHTKFLLHRVESTWFYNDKQEVLLQKRSMKKDMFPGVLSISASGHVDHGQTREEAAIREIFEETGLKIRYEDLTFLERKIVAKPPLAHFPTLYAYKFNGNVDDLKFDKEEVESFVWVPVLDLYNVHARLRDNFHPFITSPEHLSVYVKLLKLMGIKAKESDFINGAKELA